MGVTWCDLAPSVIRASVPNRRSHAVDTGELKQLVKASSVGLAQADHHSQLYHLIDKVNESDNEYNCQQTQEETFFNTSV